MAVTVYKSTDAGAPTLTGQVGSLTTLLLACLVNGYGAKAAAGWGNPFNGAAGQSVFRPGTGVRHYFQFFDDASDGGGIAGAKEAVFSGFETMTAWATGTGQFPTAAQLASSLVMRKSSTADATTRPWIVIADDRTCYVFVQTGDAAGVYMACAFGEMYSLMSVTDNYRSLVIGRNLTNTTTTNERLDVMTPTNGAIFGHYMPRTYTGLGSSIQVGKFGQVSFANANDVMGNGGLPTPDPVTGAVILSPLKVVESGTAFRGRVRGLFHLCHGQGAFGDGDTITGVNGYAGRTFLVIKQSANTGAYCLDITGPWETN